MEMATCHSKHSSESEWPSLEEEEEEEAEEQEDEDDEGQLQHDLVRLNFGLFITPVCIASPMFDIRLSNTYKICNASLKLRHWLKPLHTHITFFLEVCFANSNLLKRLNIPFQRKLFWKFYKILSMKFGTHSENCFFSFSKPPARQPV